MSKTLLIVESPSKAKTISKYVGGNFVVKASYGHLVDLGRGGLANTGISVEDGFSPKYTIIPDKKEKLELLIKAAKGMDEILLAADPDREGEAIAWHLNEQLQKLGIPIKRVTFHELTKKPILQALEQPRELDTNLFLAQQARRVLDRLVGYLVSPFLGKSLSAGRVQSVATRLIVDKDREIEAFVPEEYWNFNITLGKTPKEPFQAKYVGRITNSTDAEALVKDLFDCEFIVSNVEKIEKKVYASPPLITSSLAGAASATFKYPVAKTTQIAQTLYEMGVITYIRTDSVRCSPDSIESCREWLKTSNYQIPTKPNFFKTKDSAQDAHEAIRPTDVERLPENFFAEPDVKNVYKLIWERFVASQMEPAIYNVVNVTISTPLHTLKASGKTLVSAGWQEILKESEKNVTLPKLEVNDKVLLLKQIKSEKKATQPPPRFNEKTLITELEKKEIGRPSTYSAIVTKITDKKYVYKSKEVFIATELGKKVVDKLKTHFGFMTYDYTAKMEKQLDLIAEGKLEYTKMLDEFYQLLTEQLKAAYAIYEKDFGFVCNKCERYLQLKKVADGFLLKCNGCQVRLFCDIVDSKIELKKREAIPGVICPVCQDGMSKVNGMYGAFYSCLKYPLCGGSLKEWQVIAERHKND